MVNVFKKIFLVTCILWLPISYGQSIEQIRDLYVKVEHEARYGNKATYLDLAEDIKDYPLAPYAEAIYLTRYMSLSNKHHITDLISNYPDAPFTHKLQATWLRYLADGQLRQAFLEQYVDVGDTQLTCLNLTWQLQNGAANDDILPQVDDLWMMAFSQPKECNFLFDKWKKAGYLTSDKALQRLILAAKEKNYGLLSYLKSSLTPSDVHLADLWKLAVTRPANVAKSNFFKLYNDKEKEILLYALNKMVFVSPEKVDTLWSELSLKFPVSIEETNYISKRIALAYAVTAHDSSLEWLLKVPAEVVDESVKQWRLAYSLEKGDWQQTLNIVSSLPEQMQTDESVVYWKARALDQLGDITWSKRAFSELSERRDYYGFLAANKMGVEANLRHEPLRIFERDFIKMGNSKVMQRAFELFKLNRLNDARKEWNVLVKNSTTREKLAAAKLAYNWGWYDRPIFTLAKAGYLNDVNLRFPLAYKNIVSKSAKNSVVDPAFVFAIARRESSFMRDAYSSAGAAGLMQLKPSTASYMAKSKIRTKQLFKPERNVKLATNYLSYLMKKSKGNPIVATAAYNAGFSRVKRWLPEKEMAADAWIETIPYKETRNYVKAVMAYTEVYQQLLKRPDNVFANSQAAVIGPDL
jgi:soluble lytic murein transglycosylase